MASKKAAAKAAAAARIAKAQNSGISFVVSLEGFEEVSQKLAKAGPRAEQAFKRRVAQAALRIQADAKARAPRKFGFLRNSIRTRFEPDGMNADVYSHLHYAAYVEYGTGRMGEKAAAWIGVPAEIQYDVSRKGFPGRAFFTSSWNEERARFRRDTDRILRATLPREL